MNRGRAVARLGLLAAAALVLGYVESLFPLPIPIPGVKLGLANTVLLYALYLLDVKQAWLLMGVKVVLSGFLFSGLSGLLYSLAGGVLSLAVMALLLRVKQVSVLGVSAAGAAAHNLGQAGAACLVLTPRAVLAYVPVLLLLAIPTGLLTGLVAKYVMKSLAAKPHGG